MLFAPTHCPTSTVAAIEKPKMDPNSVNITMFEFSAAAGYG